MFLSLIHILKIVVLDGYTENPGDLSWEGLQELGELTVYDRTPVGLSLIHIWAKFHPPVQQRQEPWRRRQKILEEY